MKFQPLFSCEPLGDKMIKKVNIEESHDILRFSCWELRVNGLSFELRRFEEVSVDGFIRVFIYFKILQIS